MEKPWFKSWFGETYKRLYPHRDRRQAAVQARAVLNMLPVTPQWRILDIGCGAGRHLSALSGGGSVLSAGLDLSLPLLRDARAHGLAVVRADMRRLPFRAAGFDLVTCFFTSFGYFATFEEDVEALAGFVSLLKPSGYLFLDLINKGHLVKHLIPHDLKTVDGAEVEQRRRLEGDVVVKEIEVRRPGCAVERFEERVRLYRPEEILSLAGRLFLRHVGGFGDEEGGAYHPETSPRMSLLFQLGG